VYVLRMKVFISWSGDRSRLLADALRDFIVDVIQSVECFCSTEDIRAGQRWNSEVNDWLATTDFGILCVTPENVKAPWLNFEAGALAKRINDDARVVPITLGFSPSALEEPLKQFNGVPADRAGILRMMKSISDIANPGVDVVRAFDRWYSDLDSSIQAIPLVEGPVAAPEPPDVSEMFTDLMASVRGLSADVQRSIGSSSSRIPLSEYVTIASMLSEDDILRRAVADGEKRAVMILRDRLRRGESRQDRARYDLMYGKAKSASAHYAGPESGDETDVKV
jgi:hypothetical protein